MIGYILRRLFRVIIIGFAVATIVFIVMQLVPGDPVQYMLRGYGTSEQEEQLRHRFGLDQPLFLQYLDWLAGLIHGHLGFSICYQQPIERLFLPRLQATLELALGGLLLALLTGIPCGVIAAVKAGGLVDGVIAVFSLIGVSVPVFVIGVFLQLGLSIYYPVFPSVGRVSLSENVLQALRHLFLPMLTIALGMIPYIIRNVRSEMLAVLRTEYIKVARAKGLSPIAVYFKHALRNSLFGTLAMVGINFGLLLGGSVVTELVFQWPGLGTLFVDAVLSHDYQLIQAIALSYAMLFAIVNIFVDVLYGIIDPRIAYG